MATRCRCGTPKTWEAPLRPDLFTPHQRALFHGELWLVVAWNDDERG